MCTPFGDGTVTSLPLVFIQRNVHYEGKELKNSRRKVVWRILVGLPAFGRQTRRPLLSHAVQAVIVPLQRWY